MKGCGCWRATRTPAFVHWVAHFIYRRYRVWAQEGNRLNVEIRTGRLDQIAMERLLAQEKIVCVLMLPTLMLLKPAAMRKRRPKSRCSHTGAPSGFRYKRSGGDRL